MANPFQRASRKSVFLKIGIMGPSGSGKTMSAIRLACGLDAAIRAETGKPGGVALIDSENGSASLYADSGEFDVMDVPPPFDPKKAIAAINAAVANGYNVLIIDSGTHYWKRILEIKEELDKQGGNSFTNWGKVRPIYDELKDKILQSPIHIIVCLRAKDEYVLEENNRGKSQPRKVGMGAISEPGSEYEYTVVFSVGMNHKAETSKDRTKMFTNEIFLIDETTGKRFFDWLGSASAEQYVPPDQSDFNPDGTVVTEEQRAEEAEKADRAAKSAEVKTAIEAMGLTQDQAVELFKEGEKLKLTKHELVCNPKHKGKLSKALESAGINLEPTEGAA